MDLIICPHCHSYVVPKEDSACPACLQLISDSHRAAGIPVDDEKRILVSDDSARASFLRESSSDAAHRPTGLIVLATIQFFFAGSAIIGLLMLVGSSKVQAEVQHLGKNSMTYAVASPLITSIALVASAFGYLSQSRVFGYWGGNVFAVGAITNIAVVNALNGFTQFPLYIPSLLYPVILLFFLNLHFRNAFR